MLKNLKFLGFLVKFNNSNMSEILQNINSYTSGMLCNAIATAIPTPADVSAIVATNVAKPSGKLCMAIAIPLINP